MYFHAHSSTIYNSQDMEQPKCPSTGEWIKKVWYIYSVGYYSAIEKTEIMPFEATWMDLEIIILNKVSHIGKNEYRMILLLHGFLKNDTNELIYRTEIDLWT